MTDSGMFSLDDEAEMLVMRAFLAAHRRWYRNWYESRADDNIDSAGSMFDVQVTVTTNGASFELSSDSFLGQWLLWNSEFRSQELMVGDSENAAREVMRIMAEKIRRLSRSLEVFYQAMRKEHEKIGCLVEEANP